MKMSNILYAKLISALIIQFDILKMLKEIILVSSLKF